jgi:hypothetical protein
MTRAAVLTAVALLLAAPVYGQPIFEIEAGGGYTLVNVEGIAEADGAIAQEWEQPSYRFAARALFAGSPGLRFGAEVSYQHLYWYRVRIPFGSTPINREYDVTATSAMGLLRLGSSTTVLDLGAGVAFLEDPVGLVSFAVGWEVVNRVSVKLRADGLLASEPTVPVGFAVSYAFPAGGG